MSILHPYAGHMARAKPHGSISRVAERAGVSISTVSLAMNHPHRVSEATRARVQSAAEIEGYRARSGRTPANTGPRTIAVAAPFSTWSSYYLRLNGVLERLAPAGLDVVVHDLPAANTQKAPILETLPVRGDLDAVILMGVPLSIEAQQTIQRQGMPAVLVAAESATLPAITADDRYGGRLVGEHLATLGHRSVLFVHEGQRSFDYVSPGMLRYDGLETSLQSAAARVTPVAETDDLARALAAEGATAIACSNDVVAGRIMPRLRAAGVVPGTDIAMVGYDGSDLAEALDLTTVAQPFADSGRAAADLVLGMLRGDAVAVRSLTLAGELIVRGTSTRVADPAA